MLTIDNVVQFFPRGGSAYVVKYVAQELAKSDVRERVLCGSLGEPGDLSYAQSFYGGLQVAAMDYNEAAYAYESGRSSMVGLKEPFHPSFEDRGFTAPDRIFTSVAPDTISHLKDAWARHLKQNRSVSPDVVHVHHLSHLQSAVRRAYGETPVVTTLHGTDLKLLDKIRQLGSLAMERQLSFDELIESQVKLSSESARIGSIDSIDWSLLRYAGSWFSEVKRNLPLAGQLVAVSKSDRDEIVRLLDVSEQSIEVIPNGVDTDKFFPRNFSQAERLGYLREWLLNDPRGWAPNDVAGSLRYSDEDFGRLVGGDGQLRPIILWVGRFQRVKRINVLLEAFARVGRVLENPPVLLLWGGFPGECEGEHPLEVARRLGIDRDVYLLGWRGHDELPLGMNCADIMVAPSNWESFGMVYVEAAACGTPPIAAHVGGPVEIICPDGEGANGWTVRPDDSEDLAVAISAALSNPGERARRARAASDNARSRYSWSSISEQYLSLYEGIRK